MIKQILFGYFACGVSLYLIAFILGAIWITYRRDFAERGRAYALKRVIGGSLYLIAFWPLVIARAVA